MASERHSSPFSDVVMDDVSSRTLNDDSLPIFSGSASHVSQEAVRFPSHLNGVPVDSRIQVKLFDTSKSLFKRLSEDYDDKQENAKKLQAFLDCVLPGEEQKALVSLSRFLGLLPPFYEDGLADLRRFSRQDKLQRQQKLTDEPADPDTSSSPNFFHEETSDKNAQMDEDQEEVSKRSDESDDVAMQ